MRGTAADPAGGRTGIRRTHPVSPAPHPTGPGTHRAAKDSLTRPAKKEAAAVAEGDRSTEPLLSEEKQQHSASDSTTFASRLWRAFLTLYTLAGLTLPFYKGGFFFGLFAIRYLRLVTGLVAYHLIYAPSPVMQVNPSIRRRDCSVIIPTVDPFNPDFMECVRSVLKNRPGQLLIITVGRRLLTDLQDMIKPLGAEFPDTEILAGATAQANKRRQVSHALPLVTGKVTVLVDDHVFWPSDAFLPAATAPFEDAGVGAVATEKRVRRDHDKTGIHAVFNMLGCTYLMRHNWELRASNALDGAVFVISGRTSLIRTAIMTAPGFVTGFLDERCFFGKVGPLNADDDNFITRWVVERGWKIKFQSSPDATIETTVGTYPRFIHQCMRWARTTWRSNSALLIRQPGRMVTQQPWSVYAVYLTGFINAALVVDSLLVWSLMRTDLYASYGAVAMLGLVAIILASKMVKFWHHWSEHPQDGRLFPAYVLWGYFHSLIKVYALITFWENGWAGRNLDAVGDDDNDKELLWYGGRTLQKTNQEKKKTTN